MNDPGPLLVPIDAKAMVLNNTSVNFIRGSMNYRNLQGQNVSPPLFQSPSPTPFQEDQVNFATHLENHGVYLMWTLPKALRHATQANGSLSFPLVPNRWLVVRLYRPAGGDQTAAPQVASWIVQSDYLGSSGASSYVDPTKTQLTPTLLGQKVPITPASPWQEPGGTTAYFLRAVAESNPAFAAYQPFNENVFSIHDDLWTQNVAAGELSYFVQGWYSDPTADVLGQWQAGVKGNDFSDVLTELDWTATAQADGTHTSVYHGAVFGVPWTPNAPSPPASPKDHAKPQIAVGNTSVDAVVAFAAAAFSAPNVALPLNVTPAQAVDLLEAFQYNLLPVLTEPGGEEVLEQKIRAQWFGSAAAGTRWTIVDAPVVPGSGPQTPVPPAELANEATWLAALNTAQAQFDQTMRELMGVQRRLFELWWKQQAAPVILSQQGSYPWKTTDAQFTAALDPTDPNGLIATARGYVELLGSLAAQMPVTSPTVTLQQAIAAFALKKNLPSSRLLKAIGRPRFWSAVDPVLVLSGTAHMMSINPDAQLACRWPTEILTGLKVTTGPGGPAFSIDTTQLKSFLPAVNITNLPAVTPSLYSEFFLLDPTNAPLVAAAAGQTLTSTQMTALSASLAAPVPANGVVPAVLAPFPWKQPWQPLYLDWELTWYPVPFLNPNGKSNWAFDGTDYDLVPGVTETSSNDLIGRSVLTPKPSFEFKSRIDQFIKNNPGSAAALALQAVEGLVQTVDDWDFLSQALSGLTTQLASWSPDPTLTLPTTPLAGGSESYADLIGHQAQSPPNPQLSQPHRGTPTSSFEGMRGGQFSFARLTIVDVFGQTLEIVTSQTATQTKLLTADGLQVSQPIVSLDVAGLVQLPPRLLQPARLNFQFEPAANGNPIIGWVLPNHIDGGLAVYGADGVLYGELVPAVDTSNTSFVFWWAAPDTPYPTLTGLLAAQPQFGGFLSALQAAGPAAFGDFLRSIDETLWTVDPLGDRSDTFLSVLLGRPLAIVTASISLELQSSAWTDPGWPYTFADPLPAPLFLNYQFPVQLGNLASRHDGLLGYFLDGNFAAFNAVHIAPPGPNDPPLSGYLVQIGPGNWINLGFAPNGPGPAHQLTLVMDPRAAVHAQLGILPTKDVTLVPDWVDSALAEMKATFRVGPVLAEERNILPSGEKVPIDSLLTPGPAEKHGTWQWRQLVANGSWPGIALGPVDANAVFPDVPPILRDGVLQLSGGIGPIAPPPN
jgi:hypothetical protein